MKQIVQDLKSGKTILEEVPAPKVSSGHVLIKTHRTLVSLGTERMLVNFGKANYIQKARQQPEKVKQVLQKIQSDGLKPTLEAVFRKLDEPMPLGYCNAGEVVAVGKGVSGLKVGDRVTSNGSHAEVVCVPENLVAKIPNNVTYDEASFAVIGAIALQGIRLINPTFGETVVVTGLGLIGLIAAQLLKANGCEVIGLDFDQSKVDLAASWGITAFNPNGQDPVAFVEGITNGIGTDAVLITASAKTNDVISQAAQMSRKRGRIVLVGVIGLDIQRSDFYEKELSFQVSCSYGPGRYDSNYEQKGMDYPVAFVRWTENRNLQAILNAISKKMLDVNSLISQILDLEKYGEIYDNIATSRSIATVLKYKADVDLSSRSVAVNNKSFANAKAVIGIIGAGNFTKAMIVPVLKGMNANMKYIVSAGGLSAKTTAAKYGISAATTDYKDVLADKEVDTVLITTRHNLHANQVIDSLAAGKHVFVEKPLALTHEELDQVDEAYQKSSGSLTVGFNRRFSPFAQEAKSLLGDTSNKPMNVIATMNAGFIPADVWVQDMEVGGGRIIGEACHLVDLITYLCDSAVEKVMMNALGTSPEENTDNVVMVLKYKNGSQGVINYFSNGNKGYSKERVEVYSEGRNIIIDNFRKSKYFGFKKSGLSKTQDKGHKTQFATLIDHVKNGKGGTIPYEQIINTSRTVIAAVESMKTGTWVDVK